MDLKMHDAVGILAKVGMGAWLAIALVNSSVYAQEGMSNANPKDRTASSTQRSAEPVSWKDVETGLVWTRMDSGSDLSFEDGTNYCAGLPHGNHSMWRLPDSQELLDMLDFRHPDSTKGNFYLGHSKAFWTDPNSTLVRLVTTDSGGTVILTASGVKPSKKTTVLCLYNAASAQESTWRDAQTSLLWTHNSMNQPAAYQSAADYCDTLVLDGVHDWRLPTVDELASLYDRSQPRHVRGGLMVVHASQYWSRTPGASGERMQFDFDTGDRTGVVTAPDSTSNGVQVVAGALCVHSAP